MKQEIVYLKMLRLHTINEDDYLRLYRSASEERRQKADRLARREDVCRCIAAEALLKHTLEAVGTDPNTTIYTKENGKPYVNVPDFHYNISHGGDYVVIAYGKTKIGVDVEPIVESDRRISLAKRFFSPLEQALLASSDMANAATRFTILWTRKESYVKYTGVGLSQGLQSFSVDVTLPCGSVTDSKEGRLPVGCHTILTEDSHVISLCGAFDHVETEYITL